MKVVQLSEPLRRVHRRQDDPEPEPPGVRIWEAPDCNESLEGRRPQTRAHSEKCRQALARHEREEREREIALAIAKAAPASETPPVVVFEMDPLDWTSHKINGSGRWSRGSIIYRVVRLDGMTK